ncbi:c-type cytochrome [Pseudorhodoferax sp. Leaf267]|uniref:c-type cytochrome n=1 Tax=Pseudorhodoferax sp. Leaf267 TaxID=1736316 RepID=UPI0006FE1D8B|nr:c-type cytochrome [Pseudorhodoferax sp. Leaf267]KQP22976.1 cytochrome C [Pseudorhodoferax sp. Leaf267]
MSSCRDALLLACALAGTAALAQATRFDGIGRGATPAEVAAWDIDVRPDLQGLPRGQDTVRRGEQIWEAQCAFCHGSFGESNEVFPPLVGGTTPDDIRQGRVAGLLPGANTPVRTTMMKVAHVSTLWDYIRRAMPWTAPRSLTVDEVYAVTAYMLNLAHVLPDDGALSDRNMREVQQRMPNREGMDTRHAMWPGQAFGALSKPDVQGSDCMRDCPGQAHVAGRLPDHARDAHGNLAEQSRGIGATRGVQTTAQAQGATPVPATEGAALMPMLQRNACLACHAMDARLVGPSFREITARHAGQADAAAYLAGKTQAGSQGAWGNVPKPAQTLPEADARRIAQWLAAGAAP